MNTTFNQSAMTPAELSDFGFARVRDLAFDAVHALWLRRKAEGLDQRALAAKIGCDPAWISRNLRGPGNWTFRTFGQLVQALDGEAEISVSALEDPVSAPSNYDAYAEAGFLDRAVSVVPSSVPEISCELQTSIIYHPPAASVVLGRR